jgi:hypothetical protein
MGTFIKISCGLLFIGATAAGLVGSFARAQQAPTTQAAASAPPAFTEDFESGELKADVWAPAVTNGGTVTVQQDVAAHGKYALKAHYPTPATGRPYAFAVVKHLPESLKGHLFGRAYVNFPNPIPAGHVLFITAGSEGWPVSNFMEIGNRQNKAQLSYQQNGKDVQRGETMIAGPAYPIGKWFCLEWEFNDTPDTISIWIDGEKVVDNKPAGFRGTNENLIKGFVEAGFGFRSWGNVPNGFDVYYDDIAFGTSRIGPVK